MASIHSANRKPLDIATLMTEGVARSWAGRLSIEIA